MVSEAVATLMGGWSKKFPISRHIVERGSRASRTRSSSNARSSSTTTAIPWMYEPHTFVLERGPDGRVIEAFAPDFYLPEQDLYVELTVMKQSLVTRKNRKLRKLRERYPERQREALLSSRHRATGTAIPTGSGLLAPDLDARIGEVYLSAEDIRARVAELGTAIAADYAGREPILVASLKTATVFVSDLSRALPIAHDLDFLALAGYEGNGGGGGRVRLLQDLTLSIKGRDVLLVEDVVDTGMTLNFLVKTLALREPSSLAAVALLDRPYRRLVENLPVRYVGFTVPDEFFVGYGFDLEGRWRNLPDLRLLR